MRRQFELNGGQIDAVYFCPFHPEHGLGDYRRESEFRKPAPGMLLQAQQEHDIDLGSSIFVGDKLTDMSAGKTAGVGTLLYFNNDLLDVGIEKINLLSMVLNYLKEEII